jgi:hypothetical protein
VSGATLAAAGLDADHPTMVQFAMSSSAWRIVTGYGAVVAASGLVTTTCEFDGRAGGAGLRRDSELLQG